MDGAKALLLGVVQELYEQNNHRVPAAKRVRDATGLDLDEAKELLRECKPLLKKTKASSMPADPPQELEASAEPGDTQLDEETTTPEKTAEMKPEKLKEEVKESKSEACSVGSYTPEEPDNQEGLSPDRSPWGKPVPSEMGSEEEIDPTKKLEKQGTQRSIDTLRYGQQLLKGKSTVHLGSIDLDEEDARSRSLDLEAEIDREMEQAAHAPGGEVAGPSQALAMPPPPVPAAAPAALPNTGEPAKADDVPASELPTSKTNKKQWNLLDRVVSGPRATAHPNLVALWNGSNEDKRRALYQFLQNSENLEATEAAMRVTRRKVDAAHHTRQWLTIREMHDKKYSTAKIQACVARGGRPDPDAPNDPESTRYRVSMEMEEKELWQQENEMSMHTNLDCRSAVRVMSMADPAVSTVHAPDPMALVRDQLQNLQQAVAPPTPSQQPSSARAGGKAKPKPKSAAGSTSKGAGLSDVALAGKTVDEKLSLARLECKKELGQLQSMKLEVQGKPVLKEAEVSMDKHIQKLTTWYTRTEVATDDAGFEQLRASVTAAVAESRFKRAKAGAVLKEVKKGYSTA